MRYLWWWSLWGSGLVEHQHQAALGRQYLETGNLIQQIEPSNLPSSSPHYMLIPPSRSQPYLLLSSLFLDDTKYRWPIDWSRSNAMTRPLFLYMIIYLRVQYSLESGNSDGFCPPPFSFLPFARICWTCSKSWEFFQDSLKLFWLDWSIRGLS